MTVTCVPGRPAKWWRPRAVRDVVFVLLADEAAATGFEFDEESDSWLDEAEVKSALALQAPQVAPPPPGFVVCRTSAKLKRLHYIGHCGKMPGVHFHNFVLSGDTVPDVTEYDLQCVNCFGRCGIAISDGNEAEAAAEAALETSSDVSFAEGAEGARHTSSP